MRSNNKLISALLGLTLVTSCGEVVSDNKVAAVAATATAAVQPAAAASVAVASKLETEKQKVSYAIGSQLGAQLKRDELDLDLKIFTQAIEDAMQGKPSMMEPAEMMQTMQEFQKRKQAEMQEKRQGLAKENKEQGDKFLADNAKKEGIVTTTTGLQYKVLTEGHGPKPAKEATVEVHYRGTLINGEEFDSSYKRGQPATFPINRVIPGWTEALQLMPEGSKWQLFIPASLAYGPGGTGKIGPNATLLFEVELLRAAVAEEKPAAAATTTKESKGG